MNILTRYPFRHSANIFAVKNIESTFAHQCSQSLRLISPFFVCLCSCSKNTRAVTNTVSILNKTSKAAYTNFRYETRSWLVSKTYEKSPFLNVCNREDYYDENVINPTQYPQDGESPPHCRLTVSNYSECSMVPSISRVLFHPHPEDAPCNGDKGHTWGGR